MMGIKKYTIQIIPEDGEVKEIHLNKKMVLCIGCIVFLIVGALLYFSINISKMVVNKAEYNLLKSRVANLESRALEIENLNNRIKKFYDIAGKLNEALGLEISLEEFYKEKEEKPTIGSVEMVGEMTLKTEAEWLLDFVPNILPTTEGWISKRFSTEHKAIDISLKEGTSIYSTMDGKVSFVGEKEYLGITLEINNDEGFVTRYSHLKEIMVKKGQLVEKNQLIALSGNIGRSDAPHLHYGVQMQGKWIDPINYLLIRR
jgi:murein DD-endopeptidase MepM/ murein hydrolase activator NlpD